MEDVVDQAKQMASAVLHALLHISDLGWHLTINLIQDQLGIA